jgi:hypothetical protein
MEKAARQSTPPITNLTTTTTLKSVASVAGENAKVLEAGENAKMLSGGKREGAGSGGNAKVLEAGENAKVLEDQTGLLLRLRKEKAEKAETHTPPFPTPLRKKTPGLAVRFAARLNTHLNT